MRDDTPAGSGAIGILVSWTSTEPMIPCSWPLNLSVKQRIGIPTKPSYPAFSPHVDGALVQPRKPTRFTLRPLTPQWRRNGSGYGEVPRLISHRLAC